MARRREGCRVEARNDSPLRTVARVISPGRNSRRRGWRGPPRGLPRGPHRSLAIVLPLSRRVFELPHSAQRHFIIFTALRQIPSARGFISVTVAGRGRARVLVASCEPREKERVGSDRDPRSRLCSSSSIWLRNNTASRDEFQESKSS